MDFSKNEVFVFISIIQDRIEKKFKKMNTVENLKCVVTSVQADQKKASVRLLSDQNITSPTSVSLLNKSNEKLSVGDLVVVEANNGSLSDAYIKIKNGECSGWNGTFLTGDTTQRTVTVVNGIITSVV